MQLGLQIERKQFGALGIDDADVLRRDRVLKVAQFFFGDFMRIIHGDDHPYQAALSIYGRYGSENGKVLGGMRFHKMRRKWALDGVSVKDPGGTARAVRVRLPKWNVVRHDSFVS